MIRKKIDRKRHRFDALAVFIAFEHPPYDAGDAVEHARVHRLPNRRFARKMLKDSRFADADFLRDLRQRNIRKHRLTVKRKCGVDYFVPRWNRFGHILFKHLRIKKVTDCSVTYGTIAICRTFVQRGKFANTAETSHRRARAKKGKIGARGKETVGVVSPQNLLIIIAYRIDTARRRYKRMRADTVRRFFIARSF